LKRGRLEILFDILEAIQTEEVPTNIMFKARTSWIFLKEKLKFLVEAGFAEERGPPQGSEGKSYLRKRYRLTEKGRKLLYHAREIRKLLNETEMKEVNSHVEISRKGLS